DLEIDTVRNCRNHRHGADMGKVYFTRNQRLDYRRGTSNLDVLDVETMFFVDATVDRNLNMIRRTAYIGNADFSNPLSRYMHADRCNQNNRTNYEPKPSKHYL